MSIYKKRYELIIQPKRGFFKPETGKRHDLMPKGQKTEEREELKPQKRALFHALPFQGIFALFSSLRLHFGKNVVFYSVSRIFCRGLVAQSVEHRPFKAGVQGSSPCQLTFFVLSFPSFSHLNTTQTEVCFASEF